ncbi:unnamed protein product [marine sediment metagenome]|uniref:Uncharacterized protein n=1 Tax=marine sediment metagenome TaxID=412755 RepID=X0X4S2_9ZZZZ
MVLDALRGVAFEDDAGKSPDFLELLAGHRHFAENRVGNSNHSAGDIKDDNAVV